ncbi:MAG TPA: PASTA domain-containing protein [Chloroflexota bacterium]|nr:PASTA domain-containing protein [Chloroflexota bacterium]
MWEFLAQVLNVALPWPRRHAVPDLTGLTKDEANDRLLRSEYVLSRAAGAGLVVSQSPLPGTKCKAWSAVEVELR